MQGVTFVTSLSFELLVQIMIRFNVDILLLEFNKLKQFAAANLGISAAAIFPAVQG